MTIRITTHHRDRGSCVVAGEFVVGEGDKAETRPFSFNGTPETVVDAMAKEAGRELSQRDQKVVAQRLTRYTVGANVSHEVPEGVLFAPPTPEERAMFPEPKPVTVPAESADDAPDGDEEEGAA